MLMCTLTPLHVRGKIMYFLLHYNYLKALVILKILIINTKYGFFTISCGGFCNKDQRVNPKQLAESTVLLSLETVCKSKLLLVISCWNKQHACERSAFWRTRKSSSFRTSSRCHTNIQVNRRQVTVTSNSVSSYCKTQTIPNLINLK